MGWDTSAKTIKGVTYYNGTPFILNGNIPYYRNCDSTSATGHKNSVTAYYYGHYSAAYSKHPYGVAFLASRQGKVDYFVEEAAFPPATYYVYYNLNEGSGNFPTQSKVYGGSVNLHNAHPTKAGHTFKGWGTTASATSPSYYANSKYAGNASITLYAIWSINSYTVTYDANGGTCIPADRSFNYNSLLTLPTPTRTGYTFVGWKKESTNGEDLSTSTRVTGSFTAVAVWEINTYNLSVSANGGEMVSGADVYNTVAEYGEVVTIPAVSRVGYTFAGFVVEGRGALEQVGETYQYTVDTSDVVLVAQWAINEYTVTLDANTNGGAPSKIVDYNYGDAISTKEEALYIPEKPYCEFIGWYSVPEETDDEPVDLNTLVVRNNLTLYAHFKEKNTLLLSTEGSNRPAMAAVYTKDKFIEECVVMVYVDGAWRKAVVET